MTSVNSEPITTTSQYCKRLIIFYYLILSIINCLDSSNCKYNDKIIKDESGQASSRKDSISYLNTHCSSTHHESETPGGRPVV